MLLCSKNAARMKTLGNICFAIGMPLLLFFHPANAWAKGLCAGFGGMLIGISIAANLKAVLMKRGRSAS